MCEGFGMIVGKDLQAYFTAPDKNGNISHSEILRALGWKDNTNSHVRRFVRIECPDWTIKSFQFDEDNTIPGWAENSRDEIVAAVKKALRRAAPARAEYEKVRATAWAEYEKVCATARAEYEKVRAPARAEYEKVRAPAWAEYEKVRAPARAEYEKVRAPAWERLVKRLSSISGYVE